MAEDRSTIILPEGNQYPGYAYPAMGGFGNGFGSFNSIADLFGLAIIASMFGWGNNGFGGYGGHDGYPRLPAFSKDSEDCRCELFSVSFVLQVNLDLADVAAKVRDS